MVCCLTTVENEPGRSTAINNSRNPSTPQTPIPVERVSNGNNLLSPETTEAGRKRYRMKWMPEVNIFIMRTYYIITKMETDLTAYREQLHQKFIEKYPTMNVTAQRILDQRRNIIRNNLIPEIILEQIKSEIRNELQTETATTQEQDKITPYYERIKHDQETPQTPRNMTTEYTVHSMINEGFFEKVKNAYQKTLLEYGGTDSTKRRSIPKHKRSIKLFNII